MKTTKKILLVCITLFLVSCNKDDAPSMGIPNDESLEEVIVPQGRITLKGHNKSLELNFKNGTILEEKNLIEEQQTKNFQGDIFSFSASVIQRTAGHPEERNWSKEFLEVEGESIKIHQADIVFSGVTMFISYQIVNTTTYSSTYFIEAIDIFNSDTLWKIQVDHKTELHMYNDRFITVQRPNGNAGITFQIRNKTLGSVEEEKRVEDRIDRFIFDGDLIIANSWQERVFALDRSLNMVWNFNSNGANTIHSLTYENQFIFHSRDRHLYALNKDSGNNNWKTEVSEDQVLGIHAIDKSAYIGQHTGPKTLTGSNFRLENGILEGSFETEMSNDYYTTQLTFNNEFLLLITSPDDTVDSAQARLIYLPESKEVWNTNLNINVRSLQTEIQANSGMN